ncbi:cell division protein FtsK, partial [Streptomyces sp. NPDC059909]
VGPLLRRGEPVGWYEVRVAGGPASGRVVRLGAGVAEIGSGAHCTVQVPDPTLPGTALRLRIDVRGEATLIPAPGAGLTVLVDGERADGETAWPLGDTVRAGDTLLVLDRAVAPDAHLSRMSEGGLAYNRPPRLNPLRRRPRLVVPQPPTKAERAKFQFVMAFMPMLFGITMWLITKQIYMLLFCLMSPMMMAAQWISDNRDGKKKHRTSMKQYRKDLAAHEELLAATCKQEQRERRAEMPDPAEILLFATGPRRRLWERRLTDPDAMLLRIGTGTLHSDVELALGKGGMWGEEDKPEQPELPDVPVCLPFQDLGVVGVAGDRARALSTARWLTVQAAALHSPRDLSVVCLT